MPTPELPVSRIAARSLLTEALAGILQRPVRSVLTMLGTVLGIGSFVATLGLSATASGQIDQDFTVLSATQVTVRENPDPTDASMPFPDDTTTRLTAIDGVTAAGRWWPITTPAAAEITTGIADTRTASPALYAASPGALEAAGVTLTTGRAHDQYAEDASANVVLLSTAVANQLGITDLSASPAIFIGADAYTVLGIIENTELVPQLLTGVILPTSTALQRYGEPDPVDPAQVLIRTQVGAARTVADQASLALRPDDPTLLAAAAPAEPERLRATIAGRIDTLVLVLAVVALIIGAVGIANTTLVAVVERTAEIGLRRALGATPRHISTQILTEAAILGGLGGLLGTSLALAVVLIACLVQQWTPLVDPLVVYLAPLAGAAIGTLAGLYPARRASRIQPIDALHGGTP